MCPPARTEGEGLVNGDGSSPSLLSEQDMQSILHRMRRIEGQARGVQRLVEERHSCEAIMIQIEAMRAALQRVKVTLSMCHVKQVALLSLPDAQVADHLAQEVLKTLERL